MEAEEGEAMEVAGVEKSREVVVVGCGSWVGRFLLVRTCGWT